MRKLLKDQFPTRRHLPSVGTVTRLVVFSLVVSAFSVAQSSAPWINDEQREQIAQRLRTVLPAGWNITQTALNRTPDDWYTLDSGGLEIDGKNGDHTFQIWFLPKDWVGIRQFRVDRLRLVYWEGVLSGRDFKTITNTDQVPVLESIERLDMRTPSLVNSGWHEAQTLFKDRMSEVDNRAQSLVSRFCNDQPCKDEAAYSLIVLGIPARTVTLKCAAHATEYAQGFCVSALGYMGGRDSARVLEEVISDPSTSSQVQKYAAMSLNRIADPLSGPALLRALRVVTWPEATEQVVEALGRIRYGLAAPEILARMQTEPTNSFQQVYYARALASLNYQPAAPIVEKLCKVSPLNGEWILKEQQEQYLGWVPEIALMRLTASWGPPSNGIRLLLLPSERVDSTGQLRVVAVIENVGDRDMDVLGGVGDVIIDGTKYQIGEPVIIDGDITLRVNDVAAHAIDLSDLITGDGTHRIQYELGTAKSNQLTLQVPLRGR